MLDWAAERLATASATADCEAIRVDKAEVVRVLRNQPAFSQMLVTHIFGKECWVCPIKVCFGEG